MQMLIGETGSLLSSIVSVLHWRNGATSLGLSSGQHLLIEVTPLCGLGQASLSLAVFGQVEGGNFLRFLNLLLVALDFLLELVNECLHAFVVLAIFVSLEGELLDLALALPQVLLGISETPVLSIKFRFELPDAALHFAHGLLSSLECVLLGIVKTDLGVLGLSFKQLAVAFQSLGILLFSAELISEAGGIDHGCLSLCFGICSFGCHLIEISPKCLHLLFQLMLASRNGLVEASLFSKSLVGIGELLFHHATITVRLLQKSASFFKSILVGMSLSVSSNEMVMGNFLGTLFIFKFSLGFPKFIMVLLDGGPRFGTSSIGVLQRSIKIKHIRLELFLHSECLCLGLGLALNSGLHTFDGFSKVLPG